MDIYIELTASLCACFARKKTHKINDIMLNV